MSDSGTATTAIDSPQRVEDLQHATLLASFGMRDVVHEDRHVAAPELVLGEITLEGRRAGREAGS
jgi:hypothetical protein